MRMLEEILDKNFVVDSCILYDNDNGNTICLSGGVRLWDIIDGRQENLNWTSRGGDAE